MFYEPRKNDHGLPYNPVQSACRTPPDRLGHDLSYERRDQPFPLLVFNAVSDRPDMVVFSSAGYKDAITFAEETGEFVCNLATWDLRRTP